MAHQQSFLEAKKKLEDRHPHLQLLEYSGSHSLCLFLDNDFGEFKAEFSKVFGGRKHHPKRTQQNKKRSAQSELTKNKRKQTCQEKYGYSTPLLNGDIKRKIRQTNIQKFGGASPSHSKDIRDKIKKTKIERGVNHDLAGKSARAVYDSLQPQYSYTKFLSLVRVLGFEKALEYDPKKTDIEYIIESILIDLKIDFMFNKQLPKSTYRPDFILKDLIVEADGLKFHSDLYINDKNYHKIKQQKYKDLGFCSLFFRSDEIINKTGIVRSIIKAKLGLIDRKIYARKCDVVLGSAPKFFLDNHLMGVGSGKTYSLVVNHEIVASMCVINKRSGMEISRFCNKIDTVVLGGFSKLLTAAIRDNQPSKVVSFVDARYGEGTSLLKNGFSLISDHISFKWTDFYKTFHRMRYKGNSGYDSNLFKIWDCGQLKFVKEL